jgi:hypothetical protein
MVIIFAFLLALVACSPSKQTNDVKSNWFTEVPKSHFLGDSVLLSDLMNYYQKITPDSIVTKSQEGTLNKQSVTLAAGQLLPREYTLAGGSFMAYPQGADYTPKVVINKTALVWDSLGTSLILRFPTNQKGNVWVYWKSNAKTSVTASLVLYNASKSVRHQQKSDLNRRLKDEQQARDARVQAYLLQNPTLEKSPYDIDPNGRPLYQQDDNYNSVKTSQGDKIQIGGASGYGLSGINIKAGVWEISRVDTSHPAFQSRVQQVDSSGGPSLGGHATHVTGTIVASGSGNSSLKSFAYAGSIDAYTANNDAFEMNTAAIAGLLVSNHSYGTIAGWNKGTYQGNAGESEDYVFGAYTSRSRDWDEIAYLNPFYSIVKSAGNDRNDVSADLSIAPNDCAPLGYDCLPNNVVAKNVITVGAVNDVLSGWGDSTAVLMSAFSAWGPTDDGRIKPDIVANGVSLISTNIGNTVSYSSGTSMSAPSVTGGIMLLQEMSFNAYGGTYLKSASIKGLLILSADPAGSFAGPDYSFGWGLMNLHAAADIIHRDTLEVGSHILEKTLDHGQSANFHFKSDTSTDIAVVLSWTDRKNLDVSNEIDQTTPDLIHDLDLRLFDGDVEIFPWKLDPTNPSDSATQGDNILDNVERIDLANDGIKTYRVEVTHKDSLALPQDFSLLVNGLTPFAGSLSFKALPDTLWGGDSLVINWNTALVDSVAIELWKNGLYLNDVATITESDSSYTWLIPADLDFDSTYTLKILDVKSALHGVSTPMTIFPGPDAYEDNNSILTAKEIDFMASQSHSLLPQFDNDWTKIVIARKASLILSTSGEGVATQLDLFQEDGLSLVAAAGANTAEDSTSAIMVDPIEPGTYFARVSHPNDHPLLGYNFNANLTSYYNINISINEGGDLTRTCSPCTVLAGTGFVSEITNAKGYFLQSIVQNDTILELSDSIALGDIQQDYNIVVTFAKEQITSLTSQERTSGFIKVYDLNGALQEIVFTFDLEYLSKQYLANDQQNHLYIFKVEAIP